MCRRYWKAIVSLTISTKHVDKMSVPSTLVTLLSKVLRPRALLRLQQPLWSCAATSRPPSIATRWNSDTNLPSNQHWALSELVSSGRYDDALDVWEKSKASGQMDADSYTVVMAMCEQLASGEAAIAIKEDMKTQGVTMDTKCSLHYVNALSVAGRGEEAVSFIRPSITLKADHSFLSQAAASLLSSGYPELALDVCQLTSDPSTPLLCVQLECLGSLRCVEEGEKLVEKVYGGVGVAPGRVQLALVHSLSLADHYSRAVDLLSHIRAYGSLQVTLETVCVLLEATGRAADIDTAVTVFSQYWEEACPLKEAQLSSQFLQTTLTAVEEDRATHLLRATNACLRLQALALKEAHGSHHHTPHTSHPHTGHTTHPERRRFMEFDFYSFLRSQSLFPDSHTYQALLLRACFDEESVGVAERAIKTLYQAGSPLNSSSFVEWTRHCGPLTPYQASRVLSLIRRHFLARYNISLSVDDYRQLLGVELVCGSDPTLHAKALHYIRTIKNAMRSQGLLSETSHWNMLIAALTRLDAGDGPVFITYDDMTAEGVEPDLDTYKSIAGAAVTKRAARTAAFDWWRLLHSKLTPDIVLMNRLMEFCLLCEEFERAFFFFGLFKDYQLQPNMATFQTLFRVCEVSGDRDRLDTLSTLAQSALPRQVEAVTAAVRRVRDSWMDSTQSHSHTA